MADSISLDIKLAYNDNINYKEIIQLLLDGGWTIEEQGTIVFLPLNDDDMFDWTSSNISIEEFFSIIDKKEKAEEIIGVELYWENTHIGGHLLLHSHFEFSFLMNINTKYTKASESIPDYNWYAEKMIPCFNSRYHITEYSFDFVD